MIPIALVAIAFAFVLSAAAGLGGSLVLVPAMGLLLGARGGIALASLLLALHNVAKVVVYRHMIPWRASAGVLLMTILGAGAGATAMVQLPEAWVQSAMVLAAAVTLYLEYRPIVVSQRVAPAVMALAAGATSGFSGISGPLKGLAIRNLALDRMHFVGACSIVSLASDGTKVAVYSTSALINDATWPIVLLSLPLMPIAAYFGRLANFRGGERLFRGLFWLVIGGYMVRLLAT